MYNTLNNYCSLLKLIKLKIILNLLISIYPGNFYLISFINNIYIPSNVHSNSIHIYQSASAILKIFRDILILFNIYYLIPILKYLRTLLHIYV